MTINAGITHCYNTRILQWTSSDADNNSTGASWYGLQLYTGSDGYNWISFSNYWGINLIARSNDYIKINGNTIITSSNISSQSVTSAKNLSSNYSSSNLSNSPFTASTFEYGIITSGSDGLLSDLDGYSQATYINLPWTSNSFGGQLLFGTNTGKIGYRTRHSGTWTAVKLLATISDITWDNVGSKPNVAIRQSANNFIIAGDEFNFIPDNYNNRVRFNCYNPSRNSSSTVTEYWFDNGHAGTIAKILSSGEYTGTISWSNVSDKPNVAIRASANNLLCAGNEFNFISAGFSGGVWFNYQDENRANAANIDTYYFGNGRGGALAYIQSGYFSGTSAAANSVSWSNVTGIPGIIYSTGGTMTGNLTISHGGGLGPTISIINTNDSGQTASQWVIYNMNRSYNGGGLQFWHYGGGESDELLNLGVDHQLYVYGNIQCYGNAYASSDRHKKKHIQSIDRRSLSDLFDVSDKLLKKFTWKQTGKISYGFIAQQLEKYIPEAVSQDNKGIKSVSYDIAYAKILASMIQEIKALKKQLEVMNI